MINMGKVIEFADKGQVIEWDDENMKFFHMHQNGYIEEDELRIMFKQMVLGLEHCKLYIVSIGLISGWF